MTIEVKHQFVSAKDDGLDTTVVQPSDWNDTHTITMATGKLLGRSSSGSGAAEEITVGSGLSLAAGALTVSSIGTSGIDNNAVTLAKLATQADATVLANVSGSTAVPTAVSYNAFLDDIFGSTQGAVIYRNASGWVILSPGTAGYFLKTGGAGANPSWDAITGLPTQTSNSGKLLTTNGTAASWSGDSAVRARGTLDTSGNTWETGSVNLSASITNSTTGTFVLSFSSALASANYQVLVTTSTVGVVGYVSTKSTSGFTVVTYNTATGGAQEPGKIDIVVYGGF